jgi:hypothetical protein
MTSSRMSPSRAPSRVTIGFKAAATSASAKPKASTATINRAGSAVGMASPSITAETRAKVAASRANQPVVSEVGA